MVIGLFLNTCSARCLGSKIRPSSNKKSAPSANQHSPQKQQPSEKLSADQVQPSAEGARAKDYDPRALPPSGARAKDRGQRRRQGGRSGGGGNTAYPTNPANRTQASGAAKSGWSLLLPFYVQLVYVALRLCINSWSSLCIVDS